jgi:hypothetical protein
VSGSHRRAVWQRKSLFSKKGNDDRVLAAFEHLSSPQLNLKLQEDELEWIITYGVAQQVGQGKGFKGRS